MALCNCSTPHPWLLHDFLLRSPSFAATLSFSLVLSPATRSFSLCIRIYIYIYIAPFLPLFPRLSSFIHFTVLAVNAINGFRFRCLNLAFSALCLQAAHLFLSTSVLRPFVLFYLSLSLSPFLSLSLLLFFNETNEERTPTLTANHREDTPTCIVRGCTLEGCSE